MMVAPIAEPTPIAIPLKKVLQSELAFLNCSVSFTVSEADSFFFDFMVKRDEERVFSLTYPLEVYGWLTETVFLHTIFWRN